MKSILFTAAAACLIASTAHANDAKFEYYSSNPTNKALPKSTTFKTEFTNSLSNTLNYQIETLINQNDNKGAVYGSVAGKISTSIKANDFITVKPLIEVGENFGGSAAKTGQFYGVESKATVKTPVEGLTLSTGYRVRKGLGSVIGQDVNRAEVNSEYIVNKNYVLGVVYYKNSGDTEGNALGIYTKVKF